MKKETLIKMDDFIKIKNRNNAELKQRKSNTPKENKNEKNKLISDLLTPPNTNKNCLKYNLVDFNQNISLLGNSINNSNRMSNKNELNMYSQNHNLKKINKAMENKHIQTNKENKIFRQNYFFKLKLNTDNKDINHNNINETTFNKIDDFLNYSNILNNNRVIYRSKDRIIQYFNTDASNTINSNLEKNNFILSEMGNYNIKSSKGFTLKELFKKKNIKNEIQPSPKNKLLSSNNNNILKNENKRNKNISNKNETYNKSYLLKKSKIKYLNDNINISKEESKEISFDSLKRLKNKKFGLNNDIKNLNDGDYILKKK